jgi:hypothetical protein
MKGDIRNNYNINSVVILCRFTTINRVVVLYNMILDSLEEYTERSDSIDVRNACRIGILKIEKYYSRVDSNDTYSCATLLDPMLKYTWWKEEEWEEHVIKEKEDGCQSCWNIFLYSYYRELSPQRTSTTESSIKDNDYFEVAMSPSIVENARYVSVKLTSAFIY